MISMSLIPKLRERISADIDTLLQVATEISSNPEKLTNFAQQWGHDGDDVYSFVHGFLVGSVHQTAFDHARIIIGRPLTPEERGEVSQLSHERIVQIKEIISKLKNA